MYVLAKNIYNHFQAFKMLVWINIRTTVLTTKLGWIWWILDPLIMMSIYYFLIKGIFNRGGENYHIFVLCGIINWQLFTRSLTANTNIISGNKQIIRQIAFPLPVLSAIPVVTNLFFAAIGMCIVVLFNVSSLSLNTLAILPLLLVTALMSYGIGLYISVVSVFLTDIRRFITYAIRAGFFTSPVLFPASRLLDAPNIPDALKYILQFNPMMWIMPATRGILLEGEVYKWSEFFVLFVLVLVVIKGGLICIRANTSSIIKML